MKALQILFLVAIVAIAGCATASRMNRLSVGMTKKEVISAMGEPSSTAAPGNGVEFLRYELSPTVAAAEYHITQEYYVRLINGRVESYGRMGDFDSAKDPTINYNIKNR
jgi:hypothetical protein